MPTKEELERLPLTALALFCKKIAGNPQTYSEAASAIAVKLQDDWPRLQGPPSPGFKAQEEVERKKVKLKQQMVEFLAGILD